MMTSSKLRQRKDDLLKADIKDEGEFWNEHGEYYRKWLHFKTDKSLSAQRHAYKLIVLLSIIILGVVITVVFSLTRHAPLESLGRSSEMSRLTAGNGSYWATKGMSANRHLLGSDVECGHVYSFDTGEEQCKFVTETPDCTDDVKFLNYIDFVFCKTKGSLKPIGTIICILWWLFCFIGLAVTADDFFCPSLVVISKVLHLSPNIAGVTFLAFGNGSPDVFSAIAALSTGGDPALGLGGLLGAGVFVTTVVAGTISVVTPFIAMQRPFIRDVIFYIVGVYWTFNILWRGYIHVVESIGFITLYAAYVIIVASSGTIYKKQQAKKLKNKPVTQVETMLEKAVLEDERRRSRASLSHRGSHAEVERRLSIEDDKDVIEMHNLKHTSVDGIGTDGATSSDPTEDHKLLSEMERKKSREALKDLENGKGDAIDREESDEEDNEDEEDIPEWKHFLTSINPINLEEWPEMNIIKKVYEICKAPLYFTITLTCPVVNYEDEVNHNWCRYLQVLQVVVAPVAMVFLTRSMSVFIGGVVPLWSVAMLIGISLAVACICTSENDKRPKYHDAFGFLGFFMGIMWIYTLANEIVCLLKTFGIIFRINDAVLGLTLLAWGNSLGDWISDTVMAKQGFARMGFSACFGGPFFNLSIGFGGAMMISQIVGGDTIRYGLAMSGVSFVLVTFLLASLTFSLVFVVFILRFNIRRVYGLCLLIIYVTFVITAILAAFEIVIKM